MTYTLLSASIIVFALGLASCCAFKGAGGVDFDPSPAITYVQGDGGTILLDSNSLRIDSLRNLSTINGGVTYQVTRSYTQPGDDENPSGLILRIIGAGEYGDLFQMGGTRMNEVLIYYRYLDDEYVDTMRYESYLEESQCASYGIIESVLEYTGPLVQDFESQTNFPGIVVTLGQ